MKLKLNFNLFEIKDFNSLDLNTYFFLVHYAFELKKKEELDIITPFFKNIDILIITDNKKNNNYLPIFDFFHKLQGKINIYDISQEILLDNIKSIYLFNILNYYKYIIFFLLNPTTENKIIPNISNNKIFNNNKVFYQYFNLNKNFFTLLFTFSIILNLYEIVYDKLNNIKLEIEEDLINELGILSEFIDTDKLKTLLNILFKNKTNSEYIISLSKNFDLKLLKLKNNENYQIKINLSDILLNLRFILQAFFINSLRYMN